MSVTNEMIAANVRNWLQDLAIGAKAVNTKMMCGVEEEGREWRVEAETYARADIVHDGIITVYVHNIKQVAKGAELDLQHRDFTPVDDYYRAFTGEDFFIFNDVKFSGMINGDFSDEEKEAREKERRNAREQSSDSGTSEDTQMADE